MAPNGSVLRTMTAAVATCAAGVTCFAPAFPCASNGGLRLRGAPQARVACRFVCESRFQLGVYTRHVLRSLSRLLTHTCTQIHTHTPSLSVSLSHTHTSTHRHTHTHHAHTIKHTYRHPHLRTDTRTLSRTHTLSSLYVSLRPSSLSLAPAVALSLKSSLTLLLCLAHTLVFPLTLAYARTRASRRVH